MRGAGGTEGGTMKWFVGLGLTLLATYLFFDSVRVNTAQAGLISGWVRQGFGHGEFWDTSSMGIVFVPFFLGVIALFYDAKPRWPWVLMWSGLAILVVEILSRIRFMMHMKTTHLLLILGLGAAGIGLMIRSYRDTKKED